ncbi:MAG: glycoside hydrolase family 16 protein [Bacteroidales bacterium]|jgi:beta-glucanase (GH16 family)|nr:glycoside hydrolase family 16 protein [Bacteroidales bacterium]
MFFKSRIFSRVLIALFLLDAGCASEKSVLRATSEPEEKNTDDVKEAAVGDEWKLVWEDNFDGESLDPKKWRRIGDTRNSRWVSDWNRYMCDHDTLFGLSNGKLILRGMKNTFIADDARPYLVGGVETNTLQGFQQGRLEIRAYLGCAQGAWPAFWLMPFSGTNAPGWPVGGEIDIMEHLNSEDIIYQSLHSNYIDRLKLREPVPNAHVPFDRNRYNTFGVELYHDSLRFLVNGAVTRTYPRIETTEEGQFPFDDYPFFLMLDMQLGGSWVGEIKPEDLPVEMYIDWVKFYKKEK